jgi:hypothetical protein
MRRVLLPLCLIVPSVASFGQHQWPDGKHQLICQLGKVNVAPPPQGESGLIFERVVVDVTRAGDQLTIEGKGIDIAFSVGTVTNAKDYEDRDRWRIDEGFVAGDRELLRQIFVHKSDGFFYYESIEGYQKKFTHVRIRGKCTKSYVLEARP